MVSFIKDYWFGILVSVGVFICLLFTVIVAVAPHNDADMRGFAPCTYEMATDLSQVDKPSLGMVVGVVNTGYKCYFSVIKEGAKQYFAGKQATPWANYLFKPVLLDGSDQNIEPISQELLDANILDKEAEEHTVFEDIKENDDEK